MEFLNPNQEVMSQLEAGLQKLFLQLGMKGVCNRETKNQKEKKKGDV